MRKKYIHVCSQSLDLYHIFRHPYLPRTLFDQSFNVHKIIEDDGRSEGLAWVGDQIIEKAPKLLRARNQHCLTLHSELHDLALLGNQQLPRRKAK